MTTYKLTVVTGDVTNADTDANVEVKLFHSCRAASQCPPAS